MAKFKLTGKQVSEEMTEVIQRLEQGAYVPIEDIENTPELQLARSCVNNSVSTHRLSGREELRERVLVTFHGVGKSGTITRGSHEPLFPPFMQAVPY